MRGDGSNLSGVQRIFLVICLFAVLLSGCSEPVKREELNGYWLHNFEREGIDISPEGVFVHYQLSPRKVRLYTFEFTPDELALDAFGSSEEEAQSLPFTLNRNHFQTEPEPGRFQNFTKYDKPEPPTLMPEIVGLWKTEVKGSKAFWNFTEWGTVYARVELSPGRYEQLWAKFQLKQLSSGLRADKRRRVVLWGVQGEENLSGREIKVKIENGKLKIDSDLYTRITSTETLR